ncbi:MAG: hypothetical protein LBC20_00585, partial [Planctomycetaceae bacterium]|nr:hypothetical protein [Planctomycetaceae bacterium]
TKLEGGGIIGVRSNSGSAELVTATGNTFTGSNISSTTELDGGGIIGVNSNSSNAKIGTIDNNKFDTTNVTATTNLNGGGVIGVLAAGSATIDKLNNNIFSETNNATTINVDGELNGGGIIGVYSESNGNAKIGTINNSRFDAAVVTSNTNLNGGGIIGVLADNGNTEIGTVTNNSFIGSEVTSAGNLDGGGMIGVHANNGNAVIDTINNNRFDTTQVTSGTELNGGGIIGVLADNGNAELVTVTANTFTGSTVSSTNNLDGGGIIGVSSESGTATIGSINNNTFGETNKETKINVGSELNGGGIIGVRSNSTKNTDYAEIDKIENDIFKSTVDVGGKLEGGGMIGVHANAGDARINKISGIEIKGSFFESTVTAATIEGGGLIGVRSESGNAMIGVINDDTFSVDTENTENPENRTGFSLNTIKTTNGHIEGGGLIGVRSDSGKATIDSIANINFSLNQIETKNGHIQGGGLIGVRSDKTAKINSISNTNFWANNVTSATWIDGGGIIGASGSAKSGSVEPHGGIGLLDHTNFLANTVKANDGQIMGGLVYSYGAAGGMTIKDSLFGGNTFTSISKNTIPNYNAKVYGTITIDTGATLYEDDTEHVVTLISTALDQSGQTGFYGNAIDENNDTTTQYRYNSFYFGTMPYVDDQQKLQQDYAAADAKLVIASEAKGTIFLLDPIMVSQDNETNNNFTFNMEVGRKDGTLSGLFIWAGKNELELLKSGKIDQGNSGTITMYAGSTTTIVDTNSFTTLFNYGELWASVFPDADSMSLNAPNYTVDLKKGAWLNVEGHNKWDLSYNNNDGKPKVNFNGDLHFNLNNTGYYNDKDAPNTYANNSIGNDIPLLTIVTPDQASMINLDGATVHLQDFLGDIPLKSGDRFYLIDAVDDDTINQKKFINENNLSNDKDSDGNFIAYARQGLTRGYYFIIDLNGEHQDDTLVDSHYLTARLRSDEAIPAKELVPPSEGRITGVSFLNHLAAPKLYDIEPQCDPCVSCDRGSQWVKTPFVSITGDWYSADTGDASRFTVRGTVFQAGLALQKKVHRGRIFLGGFFDSGYADYNTYNYIPEIKRNPDFHSDGELTATGGGVLFRRQWKNGWQFDGTVRGGNLRNKFYSNDIKIHNTDFVMRYDTDSVYYGTDLGLTHQWKIGKRQTFDLYGRYAWMYMEGDTITWNYKEIEAEGNNHLSFTETIRFNGIHSHRLTLGARYTKKRNSNVSWYLGSAYEYELDGQADGLIEGVGRFNGSALKGGYGIGEIGLIYRQNNNFQFIAGLEGYAGDRSGGNVNLSALWKW